jgi:hypothetical protein
MKPEFHSAEIQPAFKQDEKPRTVATVTYKDKLPNGFKESIKVTVLIEETDLTIAEIEEVAKQRADFLIRKALADSL